MEAVSYTHLGGLAEALAGADVFIGVSVPGIVTADMIGLLGRDPIVFPRCV